MNKTYCEETHCQMFESAKKQIRVDLLKNIRECAIHLGYDDIEDLLIYVEEVEQWNS